MLRRWFLPIFMLLGLAAVQTKAAVTMADLFKVLEGEGACSDDYVSLMNKYLVDVETLATSFSAALDVATSDPGSADGYVARILLLNWFGVEIDGDTGLVPSENEAQWKILIDTSERLSKFIEEQQLIAPLTPPEILCDGTSFRAYSWDAAIQRWDSTEEKYYPLVVDDDEIDLTEFYDQDNDLVPYICQNNHNYYLVDAGTADDDICSFTGDIGIGSGLTMYGKAFAGGPKETNYNYPQPITIPAFAPLVIMCPSVLSSDVQSLANVLTASADFALGETQIINLQHRARGALSLFHELIHLVSFWEDGSSDNPSAVTDYSYDVWECLQMAYNGVTVKVPQADGTTVEKEFGPSDTVRNARHYEYFTLAYWYYENSDDHDTFYGGYLTAWDALLNQATQSASKKRSNVSGSRRYGQWYGHTH